MSNIIFSESFRKFLQDSDSKIAKTLINVNSRFKAYDLMFTDGEVNYLTFRNNGNISFLPAGKKHELNEDSTWKREGRQEGKAGKIIRKLFTKNAKKLFKDADFESFTNEYKAEFNEDGLNLKIFPNNKIKEVYNAKRKDGEGSLNASCMNGDGNYLDIYENCRCLEIVTLWDNEQQLNGRALLWSLEDGIKLMDRVYVVKDFQYDLFIDFAKKNNFWYKVDYKSYSSKKRFYNPNGNEVEKSFTVKLNTDFDLYPYIDTFTYGGDGFISNSDTDAYYTYEDTGGDRGGENHNGETYDDINECWISEDDAVCIERGRHRGLTTSYDDAICVNDNYWHNDDVDAYIVNIHGEWYEMGDDDVVEINDEWYLKSDDDVVEINDEWYLKSDDDVVEINDEWYLKSDDDVVEINDEWYLKSDDDVVEINDEWYLKSDDDVVEINDEWYLKSDDDVVEINDEWYLKSDDDVVEINDEWYLKSDDDVVEINDEWCLKQTCLF